MPKETFFNLDEVKRNKIKDKLLEIFSEKPYKDVTVSSIIKRLDIPRGSFYQYFNDLEDCYFYVLDNNTHDIHKLYMDILSEDGDIFSSLEKFGYKLSDILFNEDHYDIYKNRYLYWNQDLTSHWNKCHRKDNNFTISYKNDMQTNIELLYFIKSIIHSLIKRNFQESWTREVFLEKYKIYIGWMKRGAF